MSLGRFSPEPAHMCTCTILSLLKLRTPNVYFCDLCKRKKRSLHSQNGYTLFKNLTLHLTMSTLSFFSWSTFCHFFTSLPAISSFVLDCNLLFFFRAYSMAIGSGALYGSNFNPVAHLLQKRWAEDPESRKSATIALDYIFSHWTGILSATMVYFLIYCILTRGRPHVFPRSILPGIAAGVLWGLGDSKYEGVFLLVFFFPSSWQGNEALSFSSVLRLLVCTYSLVQWNWFSVVTGCTWVTCISDVRGPISLHHWAVHLLCICKMYYHWLCCLYSTNVPLILCSSSVLVFLHRQSMCFR